MIRLTTVYLKRELEKLGNPKKVGYVTPTNEYGTMYLTKGNKAAILFQEKVTEVPEIIKVVINQETINTAL